MKFNELKNENRVTEIKRDFGTYHIKYYLEPIDISTIVANILDANTYLSKRVVRDILLIDLCTDIEVETEKDENGKDFIKYDNDTYMVYKTNGIIEDIENNINEDDLWLIDECVSHEESVANIIKGFCENANKMMEENSKNIDVNKMIEMLKEIENGSEK